jgi:hypothetical protein
MTTTKQKFPRVPGHLSGNSGVHLRTGELTRFHFVLGNFGELDN